jgi:hypothetical protein
MLASVIDAEDVIQDACPRGRTPTGVRFSRESTSPGRGREGATIAETRHAD